MDLITDDSTAGALGLRERKKLDTRDALVRAAVALFEERGFDATTVDDIADAVQVSARTFHRYFGAKEDVLFSDSSAVRDQFVAVLAARPPDEPLLESLRAAALDMAGRFVENADHERRRLRLIRDNPTLVFRSSHRGTQWSSVVADHAAERLGQSPDDPLPTLLAACTVAALRTSVDRWIESPGVDYRTELARCFDLLADLRTATTPRRSRAPR